MPESDTLAVLLTGRRLVRDQETRLLEAGFRFDFPSWPAAARDLVARMG